MPVVGEYVPPPAPAPAPAVAAPPTEVELPDESELGRGDPIHAPLDTSEVALPVEGTWEEPGVEDDPTGVLVGTPSDRSWPGVRSFDEAAVFEPRVEELDADQWADEVPPEPELETSQSVDLAIEAAESMLDRGDLSGALGVYQDLAVRSPEDSRLWKRVEEIARMLQNRSSPPPSDE
ncbi:MAG: hypothetical protein R3B82_13845 [Sandaracinaceae bacterium]